ncbi:MAG TPA: DUF4332 domain-containing protein [Caulifigura sp.]|nr:DUF4332 domain-containing protein [Caulifigura sp.]
MKLTDLSIDHFGALSKFSLPEIAPGLNVLHGPNGSGKTTLMQFIRGVFAGFAEARRRQLIPPVDAGAAGGAIGVEFGSRRLAVIRHSRPDEYETLAINVRGAQGDEGQSLRKYIESFDDERLNALFTAGSFDANSVEGLIALARTDGLDLTTVVGNERPLSTRLTHLHSQRSALLRLIGESGRRAELQAQREAIAAEMLSIQHQADELRAELLRARVALDERLAVVGREIEQLYLEWQALETDLAQCEDRLWNAPARSIVDVVYVQETVPPSLNPRLPEVEELDLRIEHLRTALKDLAASRRQLSVEAADAEGSDVPDQKAFAARQRESLRVMQLQLQVLGGTVQWIESARHRGRCVCDTLDERLMSVVDEMRRQVEFACQELSRQQTAWKLEEARSELASLDETERGLQRQLHSLRVRREELLDEAAHPTMSRLAHTVTAERQFCGCPQHSATMRATTPRMITRRTVQERQEASPKASPEDTARWAILVDRKANAWTAWQNAMSRSCDLERQRRRVINEFHDVDIEPALADCQRRMAVIEQELIALKARQAELAAIESEIRSVEDELVRDQSSRLISEASENLDLLTLGRYRALRIGKDGLGLQIVAENGSSYVASALSRGTLFQVALALRIALVDEYARRGLEFPLVLDDVLVDSDEHRLEAAAQLLTAAARRGRQILFLTCQDHLVDMLEDRGAAVHSLPGAIRSRQPRSTFVPAAAPIVSAPPEPAPVITTSSLPVEDEIPQAAGEIGPRSSVRIVPSLSSHFAALLSSDGIHTLGQLVALDPFGDAAIIARLGATRQDLAVWQAEASLLIGIPGLSSDDARLLAAIGLQRSEDLRNFTTDALWQRIQRFRGSTPQPWHAWMRDRNSWPREEEIAAWIRSARHPRPQDAVVSFPVGAHVEGESPEDDPDHDGPHPAGEQDAGFRKRTRRSRRSRLASSSGVRPRGSASASSDESQRYYLALDSAIVDAPSIGPKTARILNRAGVQTVAHLLQRSADELAGNISDRSITSEMITSWQQQSRLMCEIPNLRGHDSQLLVACGFTSVESIAASRAEEIHAAVTPFAASKAGQRLLRSSEPPVLEEIAGWIESAHRNARKAA